MRTIKGQRNELAKAVCADSGLRVAWFKLDQEDTDQFLPGCKDTNWKMNWEERHTHGAMMLLLLPLLVKETSIKYLLAFFPSLVTFSVLTRWSVYWSVLFHVHVQLWSSLFLPFMPSALATVDHCNPRSKLSLSCKSPFISGVIFPYFFLFNIYTVDI